jgi:hypothetical protein
LDSTLLRLGMFAGCPRSRLRILVQAREMSHRAVIISALWAVSIAPTGMIPWQFVSRSFAADDTQPAPKSPPVAVKPYTPTVEIREITTSIESDASGDGCLPLASSNSTALIPTAVSKSFAAEDTQPAPIGSDLNGRILTADGRPVNGATVFVTLPGPSSIRIRNGRVDFANSDAPHVVTGVDGEYLLPPQPDKFLLQVVADVGFGRADQDTVLKSPDIQLTAWGRIQGRLMVGTKPGAAIELQAFSIDRARVEGPLQVSMVNRAQTDANGNFTMDRVVPGLIQIRRGFEQRSGSNTMTFFGEVGAAQSITGQTTTVNFGGVGRPVVGKFVFPQRMNPSDYFINARASAMRDNSTTPRQYFLEVDAQHNFQIDNVIPGDYGIHVFMQKVLGDRAPQPNQVKFTMPDVPGGVSDEPLVIPDIQLQ